MKIKHNHLFFFIKRGKTVSPCKNVEWNSGFTCNLSVQLISLIITPKFQFTKCSVELNSLLLKFFCYVTWFYERRNWRRICQTFNKPTIENIHKYLVKYQPTLEKVLPQVLLDNLQSWTKHL